MEREPRSKIKDPALMLGIEAGSTHAALQTDCFKELVNKIAWALGSAYRQPYSGVRTPARQYAVLVAAAIQRDHGYPRKIAKDI